MVTKEYFFVIFRQIGKSQKNSDSNFTLKSAKIENICLRSTSKPFHYITTDVLTKAYKKTSWSEFAVPWAVTINETGDRKVLGEPGAHYRADEGK